MSSVARIDTMAIQADSRARCLPTNIMRHNEKGPVRLSKKGREGQAWTDTTPKAERDFGEW